MPHTHPLDRLQTIIARNMHLAMQETAHPTLHTTCEVTAIVEATRDDGTSGMPFSSHVLYALVQTLADHPHLNAHLSTDELCVYESIKLGLMLDGPHGIMVGCIDGAGTLSLAALDAAVQDLTERARAGRLQVAETRGATFLVSDLSDYPVDAFTPTLLPSAIVILGLGRVRTVCRPAPAGCRPAQVLSLSLTFDHRGTDSLVAGRFLAGLVERLERPPPA